MNSISTHPPHQDIKTASSQACYECHIITMATNHCYGQWTGAWDSSWAPHVCFFFFPFFQKNFYTNVNFLIKWTTSSYATTNSSTLTSWPCQHVKTALAQHKKHPNNGLYHHLGLRYACYKCHVTTTATNHHNWRWMGDLSWALMYVFFPVFISFFSILTWTFY